jgi:hypothetical protein
MLPSYYPVLNPICPSPVITHYIMLPNIVLKLNLALWDPMKDEKNGSPAVFLLNIIEKEAGIRTCYVSSCQRVILDH